MTIISSTDPRVMLREERIDDANLMVIPRACVRYRNSIMNKAFYHIHFVFTISQCGKETEKYNTFICKRNF